MKNNKTKSTKQNKSASGPVPVPLRDIQKLLVDYDYYKYTDPNDTKLKSIKTQLDTMNIDGLPSMESSAYKPYPSITSDSFYENLLAKNEIAKHKVKTPNKEPCQNKKFALTDNQKFLRTYISPYTPYNGLLLYHGVGVGKCFAKNTRILKYDYTWAKVQDIEVGDEILGDDNTKRTVLTKVRGRGPMYRIVPEFGNTYVVNSEHILCFVDASGNKIDMSVVDYLRLTQAEQKNLYGYRIPILFSSKIKQSGMITSTSFLKRLAKEYLNYNYDLSDYPVSLRTLYVSTVLAEYATLSECGLYLVIPYNEGMYITFLSLGVGCFKYFDELRLFGNNLRWFISNIPIYVPDIVLNRKTIFNISVEIMGEHDYYGFSVDGNHRFVIEDYIVTHNSCSAITIAESLNYPKRPLVLLPSSIKDNFKQQIFDYAKGDNQCTGNKYKSIFDSIGYDSRFDNIDNKVNSMIKTRYDIYGFLEFANQVKEYSANTNTNTKKAKKSLLYIQRIKEAYSNRVIIIDEAHNIRTDSTHDKIVPPILMDVIEYADNIKLILLTATPMFNSVEEIIWLLNLLLLNDKRTLIMRDDVFDKDGVLTLGGAKLLKEKSRGYVSYMRGETPYAFPVKLFAKEERKQPPVLDLNHQKIPESDRLTYDRYPIVYSVASPEHEDALLKMNDSKGVNFKLTSLQNTNVYKPGKTLTTKDIADDLDKYAPKIAKIIKYAIKAKGIVFIYSYFIEFGLDIIVEAIEKAGFTKYNSSAASANKGKSYILLSGTGSSGDNVGDIAVSKSEANKDGDLIKIIIGSSVASEGVDFKNIREIHILEPWYHMNRIEQTIGRGIRYCSHVSLPQENRNTTIYLHCLRYGKNTKIETIDEYMYRLAQNKSKEINKVDSILKSGAVDCSLNRNISFFSKSKVNKKFVLETSQGKKIKDWELGDDGIVHKETVCYYDNDTGSSKDNSTIDKRMFYEDIDSIKQNILDIYDSDVNIISMSYDDIVQQLSGNIDRELISYALDDIVKFRVKVRNSGYLIYRSNKYLFQPYNKDNLRVPISQRKVNNRLVLKYSANNQDANNNENDGEDMIKYINENKIEIEKRFGNVLTKSESFEDVIVDYIIDNITDSKQLLDLCRSEVLFDKSNSSVVRSLREAAILLSGDDNSIVRDVIGDRIYVMDKDSGKYRVITQWEYDEHIDIIRKSQPKSIDMKDIMGAVAMNTKKGNINFKVMSSDKKSDGYVCHQTASLKVGDLREIIVGILKESKSSISVDSISKISKEKACMLYELLLRKYKKNNFARFYQWKTIKGSGGSLSGGSLPPLPPRSLRSEMLRV